MSDDPNIYCICRSRDDGTFMLACDRCENWFHGRCVNISRHRAKHLTKWHCESCVALHGMPPKQVQELAAEISSSEDEESNGSHASASSSSSESVRSGDDNAQPASSKKKRKTPSSLRRSSSNAQVKRRVGAAAVDDDDDDDGEAAQRRDEARARVRERLTEVLLPAISEAVVATMNAMLAGAMVGGAVSDSDVRQVAAAIEACLFEQCGKVADSNYVGKARSLLFNLKTTENEPLRVSLVRGQITPLQLCNMSAKDMAPARLAESIKRFEQQSMSQHVITAEVAAEKFKKSDIHTNRSENNGVGSTTAATAVDGADVDDEKKSAAVALKNELAASVGGDEARDDTNAGATASTADAAANSPSGERAPKVSMGAIKSFADFEDDSVDEDNAAGTATLDDIDADDDAAALLDPDVDRAHFGRRISGGVSRDYDDDDDAAAAAAAADLVDSGATIEPYTPPGTPPPLSPSDETNGSFADADASMAPSRRFVNAQTALFGVNLDMDSARADGTLNCRGKLPLAVVRALTSKMSVVGRMELEKCDSYLAALSSSSSRDRALCYVSASGADSSEKLAQIAQSLRERARVGVVKLAKSNPNLRECFLIPWNGTEPLPTFLTQFTTLLPQPADDAPLLVVLVLSKQPGAAGVAAGLLTSSDGAAHASAGAAPPPVAARVPTPAATVPTPPTPVLFGGAVPPSQLSLALSSLAASLASGGGAALLAATRGAQALPPQQPALMQQPQQPQQPLPHQLHQQQLQQQQQMRQLHILMQQQQQQQQHHRFGPPQHHQQPMMQQQRPGMPIDPRTGLPLQRGPGGQPPPRGW